MISCYIFCVAAVAAHRRHPGPLYSVLLAQSGDDRGVRDRSCRRPRKKAATSRICQRMSRSTPLRVENVDYLLALSRERQDRCATVEVPAAVCGAQSASSSRGKFGPFAQVSRPALFASESSVSNSRPGLRHSVASTYKAMDHKQGDGKSTRGANPTRSCEDREHGPIPRRRCRRRVGTVRADGGLTRADVPGNIDATELWTSVHVEAPRIDSSYSW